MVMKVTAVKRASGWPTTDGQIFESVDDARDRRMEIDFHAWCKENVCIGGEWSPKMVADKILETFILSPKFPGTVTQER